MEINKNFLTKQKFENLLSKKLDKKEIQSDIFQYSEISSKDDISELLTYLKATGEVNKEADRIAEEYGRKGIDIEQQDSANPDYKLYAEAVINSRYATIGLAPVLAPLIKSAMQWDMPVPEFHISDAQSFDIPDEEKDLSGKIITVDLNDAAVAENHDDYMVNEPRYRAYIGFEPEEKKGFVYFASPTHYDEAFQGEK